MTWSRGHGVCRWNPKLWERDVRGSVQFTAVYKYEITPRGGVELLLVYFQLMNTKNEVHVSGTGGFLVGMAETFLHHVHAS
jgi:hypothetical protein